MNTKIVDLFAGCGGLSLGFQNAGFDIIAAFEYWDVAADCYALNFNHPVFRTDLSDTESAIKEIKAFSPDIIIGGPPCQDFSFAGKRIEAGRAGLTSSFATIITTIHPNFFIMENVDRAKKSNAYAFARKTFKDAGYGLTEIVLDASLCGTPQKRKRFICFGALGKEDGFATNHFLGKISQKSMTLRDYFGNSLGLEYYYRHPRNYSRRGVFSIDEPAPTMRGVNRPVPRGYPGNANDACPIDNTIRALTTEERAWIQTFPKSFKWCGSKTDMEQMIGNAVPVNLAMFVAQRVKEIIEEDNARIDKKGFKEWLTVNTNYSGKVVCDIISRLHRVDSILPWRDDDIYLYRLDHTDSFENLSSSVKSQCKRAVTLYTEYARCAN